MQLLTPKEPEAPKESRETYAQAVRKSPSRQHPFKPPSPPSSPHKGGGKGFAKRPAQWCFTCERARRNSLHDQQSCAWWKEEQRAIEEQKHSPPRGKHPQSPGEPKPLCLTCHLAGRPPTMTTSWVGNDKRRWRQNGRRNRPTLPKQNHKGKVLRGRKKTSPKENPKVGGSRNPRHNRGVGVGGERPRMNPVSPKCPK